MRKKAILLLVVIFYPIIDIGLNTIIGNNSGELEDSHKVLNTPLDGPRSHYTGVVILKI